MALCADTSPQITSQHAGNMSSGQTSRVERQAIACGLPAVTRSAQADLCCATPTPPGPFVQRSSLYLEKKIASCQPPTPEQFAQYPKVAIPESVRIQTLASGGACATLPIPSERFAQYRRFQPAPPCPPLPPEANMAGISKPSTRGCPPWPR
jgi:hypothetical protein